MDCDRFNNFCELIVERGWLWSDMLIYKNEFWDCVGDLFVVEFDVSCDFFC